MLLSLRQGRTALSVTHNCRGNQSRRSTKVESLYNCVSSKRISTAFSREKESIRTVHLTNIKIVAKNIKAITPDLKCRIYAFDNLPNRFFYSSTLCHSNQMAKDNTLKTTNISNNNRSQPQSRKKQFSKKKKNASNKTENAQSLTSDQSNSGVNTALHNLNLSINRTGRVYLNQVMGIFHRMQQTGEYTPTSALLLLRCCGNFMVEEKLSTRADLSEKMWKNYQDMGVKMDTSHYNTLLKNRLENKAPEFQSSDFLAMMEENGMEPNRVTFQYLISKFCSDGDIIGATAILEHMKEKKIAMNECVFHSLIIGHCRSDDFNSGKDVMKIMVDAGIDVSSDTKMIYVMELARAEKDFRKELDNIVEGGGLLSDHEFLKLMILLLEKGNKAAALEMVDMLPKKRGFYQEIRNFIPAMLATGDLELPISVYNTYSRTSMNVEKGKDSEAVNVHPGLFFLKAMVRNGYDPEMLLEYAEKIIGLGKITNSQILEYCVEHGNIPYGQSVYDAIDRKSGGTSQINATADFLRKQVGAMKNQEAVEHNIGASDSILQLLIDMGAIGLRARVSHLSEVIIPAILKLSLIHI